MAYTIPVVALVVDEVTAAALIGEAPDFFEDYDSDKRDGADRVRAITGAPISSFSNEDGDIFYMGIEVASDFYIELSPKLLAQEAALRAKYPHPLIQSAKLAVVSRFC